MYTPGHSKDHICLFDPDRGWLFSGDLFVGGEDRALRSDCDIWQIIESLKRIADLPMKVLFPGSARVRECPIQAISEKISYLQETGSRVQGLHEQGLSCKEIARQLFGKPMAIEFFTMGDFSRLNLVKSFLKISR
jgi:glyoxylase-like metal-dependent hydrolase (beta-lactamase superfamily II)